MAVGDCEVETSGCKAGYLVGLEREHHTFRGQRGHRQQYLACRVSIIIYSTDEKDSENSVSYEKTGEKTEDGEEILLRHVKRIDNVYDFTITPKPAFEQTNVTKRELEDAGIVFDKPEPKQEPVKIDLAKKREAIRKVKERINRTV